VIYNKRDMFLVKLAASYAKKTIPERAELLQSLHPDIRDMVVTLATKALERITFKG